MPKINIDDAELDYLRVEVSWGDADEFVCIKSTNRSPDVRDDGVLVELDRIGINRLIKGLRQARDAKYGRDE